MKHNAIVWERPLLWYVIALLGFAMFAGSAATGQLSILYTPLVLVVGIGSLGFGAYLTRKKDA